MRCESAWGDAVCAATHPPPSFAHRAQDDGSQDGVYCLLEHVRAFVGPSHFPLPTEAALLSALGCRVFEDDAACAHPHRVSPLSVGARVELWLRVAGILAADVPNMPYMAFDLFRPGFLLGWWTH